MIRCAENAPMEFFVNSDSSSKIYRVRAFLVSDEASTCDCVAFAISRNRAGGKNNGGIGTCKHIKKVLTETCPWTSKEICPWTSKERKQMIPGVCPVCGGPTVDTDANDVLPELPRLAMEEATKKLLAMAAELEGRASDPVNANETVDDLMKHVGR